MEEDDLEKRIADLEGRAAEPVDDPGEDSAIRRAVKTYWMPVAIAVLTLLAYSLSTLERFFPALKSPAPWITNGEVFPEFPSIQGWVEAMTSLGRLIFFDQPGTGASDPVTADEMPNMEQWADSISAVLDHLGSREAVILAIDGAFADGRPHAAALRQTGCADGAPTIRVPTLVLQHTDDQLITPAQGKYIATTYLARSTSSSRAATCTTSSSRGGRRFRRSPSSSPVSSRTSLTTEYWPWCCSPTS